MAAMKALTALKGMKGMAALMMKPKLSVPIVTNALPPPSATNKESLSVESKTENKSFTGFDVSVPMKTPMDEFLESLSEILVKIKEFLAKPVKKKASADRAKVLESIDLFEDLDEGKYRELSTVMSLMAYDEGHVIVKEGEQAETFHVVVYCEGNDKEKKDKTSYVSIVGGQDNNKGEQIELAQLVVSEYKSGRIVMTRRTALRAWCNHV